MGGACSSSKKKKNEPQPQPKPQEMPNQPYSPLHLQQPNSPPKVAQQQHQPNITHGKIFFSHDFFLKIILF